jgi:hypothetical protein
MTSVIRDMSQAVAGIGDEAGALREVAVQQREGIEELDRTLRTTIERVASLTAE